MDTNTASGLRLIAELQKSSELPEDIFKNGINHLQAKYQLDPNSGTIDDLRAALAELLQDMILEE